MELGGSDSGSDLSENQDGAARNGGGSCARSCAWRCACVTGLLGVLVLACTITLAIRGQQFSEPQKGDPALSQTLEEAEGLGAIVQDGFGSTASIVKDTDVAAKRFNGLARQIEGKFKDEVSNEVDATTPPMPSPDSTALVPTTSGELVDDVDEGAMICADDEELHVKLCYKKCALLTDGSYPIRSSAWTCCRAHPCGFFNSRITSPLKICHGFDVGGDNGGSSCPHSPGTCRANEEFSLGMCYKKCSDLTNGVYPHRVAAATCCKVMSHIGCLWFMNVKTRMSFAVGGGEGGDDQVPHGPVMISEEDSQVKQAVPSVV